MSVALNEPKWRKFLSLKRQRNIIHETIGGAGSKELNVVRNGDSENQSAADDTSPTKKRKRSEEEIVLRKAKKLKSKNKEGRSWEQLSEEHRAQSSAKTRENEKGANAEDPEPIVDQLLESAKTPASDAASPTLLASKAKEIAKARKKEKLQEKQKRGEQPSQDTSKLEPKTSQILQYLEEYRSHINSGSEWKFKKQHQNWIVKNLYTYAWESDDLVITYLKSVKGQARQRLALGAKELTDDKEGEHGEEVIRRAERVLRALGE